MEEVAKRFFPIGYKFSAPFTFAQSKDALCTCVGCGQRERAGTEISTYPHKYIPPRWRLGNHGSTHCNRCNDSKFDFWITRDAVCMANDYGDKYYSTINKVALPEQHEDSAGNLYKWDPASEGYVMYTSEMRKKTTAEAKKETAELIKALAAGSSIDNPGKKDTNMSEKLKKAAKNEVSSIQEAISEGAKLAAANQAGEATIELYKSLTKDFPAAQLLLATENGKEFAKFLTATLIHVAAEAAPDLIPQAEVVAGVTKRVQTLAAQHVIEPHIATIRKFATDMAAQHLLQS